jgi:hypothetical protein
MGTEHDVHHVCDCVDRGSEAAKQISASHIPNIVICAVEFTYRVTTLTRWNGLMEEGKRCLPSGSLTTRRDDAYSTPANLKPLIEPIPVVLS